MSDQINFKKLLHSKTFWVSVVIILISTISSLMDLSWIQENPRIVSLLGVLMGTLILVLRLLTNQPIDLSYFERKKHNDPN